MPTNVDILKLETSVQYLQHHVAELERRERERNERLQLALQSVMLALRDSNCDNK